MPVLWARVEVPTLITTFFASFMVCKENTSFLLYNLNLRKKKIWFVFLLHRRKFYFFDVWNRFGIAVRSIVTIAGCFRGSAVFLLLKALYKILCINGIHHIHMRKGCQTRKPQYIDDIIWNKRKDDRKYFRPMPFHNQNRHFNGVPDFAAI